MFVMLNSGGIRTRNSIMRATSARNVRPHGHWNRQVKMCPSLFLLTLLLLFNLTIEHCFFFGKTLCAFSLNHISKEITKLQAYIYVNGCVWARVRPDSLLSNTSRNNLHKNLLRKINTFKSKMNVFKEPFNILHLKTLYSDEIFLHSMPLNPFSEDQRFQR